VWEKGVRSGVVEDVEAFVWGFFEVGVCLGWLVGSQWAEGVGDRGVYVEVPDRNDGIGRSGKEQVGGDLWGGPGRVVCVYDGERRMWGGDGDGDDVWMGGGADEVSRPLGKGVSDIGDHTGFGKGGIKYGCKPGGAKRPSIPEKRVLDG
jgi:hypothetical protein